MVMSKIYAELVFILDQVPYSYSKLIPEELMMNLKNNMSLDWYKSFKKDKVFYKQKFHKETILMLSMLYYKYWCENEEMKEQFFELLS